MALGVSPSSNSSFKPISEPAGEVLGASHSGLAARSWEDAAEEPLASVVALRGWSGVPVSRSRHLRPVECHLTAKTPLPGGTGRQWGWRSLQQSPVSLVTAGISPLLESLGLAGGEEPFLWLLSCVIWCRVSKVLVVPSLSPTSPIHLPGDECIAGSSGLLAPSPSAVAVAILLNSCII